MKNSTPAAQRWTAILNDWQRSGLSVARFCERRGLQAQSLYAWRRRLGDVGGAGAAGRPRGRFVEAFLTASPGVAGASERSAASPTGVWVQTRRGTRVMVDGGFDPEVLRAVVAALEIAA
jgi:transposase-like protein